MMFVDVQQTVFTVFNIDVNVKDGCIGLVHFEYYIGHLLLRFYESLVYVLVLFV